MLKRTILQIIIEFLFVGIIITICIHISTIELKYSMKIILAYSESACLMESFEASQSDFLKFVYLFGKQQKICISEINNKCEIRNQNTCY